MRLPRLAHGSAISSLAMGLMLGWWGRGLLPPEAADSRQAAESAHGIEASRTTEPSSGHPLPTFVGPRASTPANGPALVPPTNPRAKRTLDALAPADLAALDHPVAQWPFEEAGPRPGPRLRSRAWYVYDHEADSVLTSWNSDAPLPIASISKLAAALVWADSDVSDDTVIELAQEDKDFIQVTRSRLRVGAQYRAGDLLHSSLLSSDNRATAALMRSTGLSREAFAAAMNRRMVMLGIESASFGDPTGLDSNDVATARDAARLLDAALRHPRVAAVLGKSQHRYERVDRRIALSTRSSNRLAHQKEWGVLASKTGYTDEAGSCLVMRAWVAGRPVTLAMLGARGVHSRYGDAVRIRSWLEEQGAPALVSLDDAGPSPAFRPWPDDGRLPHGVEDDLGLDEQGDDAEGPMDAEGGDIALR